MSPFPARLLILICRLPDLITLDDVNKPGDKVSHVTQQLLLRLEVGLLQCGGKVLQIMELYYPRLAVYGRKLLHQTKPAVSEILVGAKVFLSVIEDPGNGMFRILP